MVTLSYKTVYSSRRKTFFHQMRKETRWKKSLGFIQVIAILEVL